VIVITERSRAVTIALPRAACARTVVTGGDAVFRKTGVLELRGTATCHVRDGPGPTTVVATPRRSCEYRHGRIEIVKARACEHAGVVVFIRALA